MAERQLVIKTGVVKRLLKEVTAYEKEAQSLRETVEKLKTAGTADEADVRQAERVQADAAKMVPDSKARLIKAAEELRELMGENEGELSESKEYKDANTVMDQYYELHGGQLVQESEAEPKDLREDDF